MWCFCVYVIDTKIGRREEVRWRREALSPFWWEEEGWGRWESVLCNSLRVSGLLSTIRMIPFCHHVVCMHLTPHDHEQIHLYYEWQCFYWPRVTCVRVPLHALQRSPLHVEQLHNRLKSLWQQPSLLGLKWCHTYLGHKWNIRFWYILSPLCWFIKWSYDSVTAYSWCVISKNNTATFQKSFYSRSWMVITMMNGEI